MLARSIASLGRAPTRRTLRPPGAPQRTPAPRLFTQNTQLLLVAPHIPRPQLPYLSQPAFRRPQPLTGPSQQLARLLSTENKTYVREQFYLAVKWTAVGWTFLALGAIAYFGFTIECDERRTPTPSDWTFFSRQYLRTARANLRAVEQDIAAFIDWARVGTQMRNCLARLEQQDVDGKDIESDATSMDAAGGKTGLDISAKSYEWRMGYFEVIMGCAAAAEHLEGMVLDATRGVVFPREFMVGPSNPDARPVPPHMPPAPLEENCKPSFAPPETYYMRILTSQGFSTRQKMDAALAYANWLEFKGLPESASEMYSWGVDIAKSALSVPSEEVIEPQTHIVKAEGGKVTQNLLRGITSLAIHQARTGDVASALPILLSVLRARRSAPIGPHPFEGNFTKEDQPSTDIGAAISMVRKALSPPSYPPPPPSGDEPVTRTSDRPTCTESELMLYIGEILFATSPQTSEGIGWTRQAVTIAEGNIHPPPGSGAKALDESKKCRECLLTGVSNWETMLRRVTAQQAEDTSREGKRSTGLLEWGGWFGGTGGMKGKTLDEAANGMMEQELKRVERLKETVLREGIEEEMAKSKGAQNGGSWIG